MEERERFVPQLVSEEKASATEDRKRLDCFVQMRFGRQSLCILGDKSEIDARKEDRGCRIKKRGAILSESNEGTIT
jgi:hypothetical protein